MKIEDVFEKKVLQYMIDDIVNLLSHEKFDSLEQFEDTFEKLFCEDCHDIHYIQTLLMKYGCSEYDVYKGSDLSGFYNSLETLSKDYVYKFIDYHSKYVNFDNYNNLFEQIDKNIQMDYRRTQIEKNITNKSSYNIVLSKLKKILAFQKIDLSQCENVEQAIDIINKNKNLIISNILENWKNNLTLYLNNYTQNIEKTDNSKELMDEELLYRAIGECLCSYDNDADIWLKHDEYDKIKQLLKSEQDDIIDSYMYLDKAKVGEKIVDLLDKQETEYYEARFRTMDGYDSDSREEEQGLSDIIISDKYCKLPSDDLTNELRQQFSNSSLDKEISHTIDNEYDKYCEKMRDTIFKSLTKGLKQEIKDFINNITNEEIWDCVETYNDYREKENANILMF